MPRIIDHLATEDAEVQCACCGRWIKRAVALSDRSGWFGLACAASLMGRPRPSGRALSDFEAEAMREAALAKRDAFNVTAGPQPRRSLPEYAPYMAAVRNAAPYADHSLQWHAFVNGR